MKENGILILIDVLVFILNTVVSGMVSSMLVPKSRLRQNKLLN